MNTGMDLIEDIRHERAEPPSGIRTLGLDRTHHWIELVEPGHVVLLWEVEDRYQNLEGAVICSWIVALADQAIFFAANTLCAAGEGTRMSALNLDCIADIRDGAIRIDAQVQQRQSDRLYATCQFVRADGSVAARVSATLEVTH